MTVKLEYIASGMGHTRVSLSRSSESPDTLRDINEKVFKHIQGINNHGYGILFNAYSEKKFGEIYRHFKDVSSVHSDSGGLQVVTLGKELTDAVKRDVYSVQAKYSDIAMSFDEIPLVVDGRSAINDMSSRRFDSENFSEYAKKSGYNLAKQIEYFVEVGVDTKPLMIVQGNGYSWFQKWVDIIMKEVPSDLHSKIGGVSIAGTSLGNGMLEAIERAAVVPDLPCPDEIKSKVHLLGVGSVVRLMPFAILSHSGYIKNTHISYDSTSHTMGMSNGSFISRNSGKIARYGKTHMGNLVDFKGDIDHYYPHLKDLMSIDDAIESLTTNSSSRSWEYFSSEERIRDYHVFMVAATFASIMNFTGHVNSMFKDSQMLRKRMISDKQISLMSLFDVSDKGSFDVWFNAIGKRYVKSDRISDVKKKTSSLEGLFD